MRTGLLSEQDRAQFEQENLSLTPGGREQAYIQKFYLYLNLTKPEEELHLFYSRSGADGKAKRPSYLIGVIRKLFPKLELQNVEEIEARADFYTKQAAIDYLIHGERDEAWYALAKYFCDGTKSEQEMTLRLLSASYACYVL